MNLFISSDLIYFHFKVVKKKSKLYPSHKAPCALRRGRACCRCPGSSCRTGAAPPSPSPPPRSSRSTLAPPRPQSIFPGSEIVYLLTFSQRSLLSHLNKISRQVGCPPPLVVRPHGKMLHQLLCTPVPVTISNVWHREREHLNFVKKYSLDRYPGSPPQP